MHCVILAAGKNSRLDTGMPKSLLAIEGASLLERHIRNFKQFGVRSFAIVTGHNPLKIREMAPILADKYAVQIDLIHNERYDLENGYSVHATRSWIEEQKAHAFYLTMGDHFFQSPMVEQFIKRAQVSGTTLQLAVDPPGPANQHIDLEDVTKVLSDEDGNIVDIGKHLKTYNNFDTGLFLLRKEVFDVLHDCFEQRQYTISHMVQKLTEKKEATIVSVPDFFWNDIDNQEDLKNTLNLIKKLS